MSSPSMLEQTNTKHELGLQIKVSVESRRALVRTNEETALPDNASSVSFIRRGVARDLEPLVSRHFLGINLSGFLINDTNNGMTLSDRKKIGLISRVIEAKLYRSSFSLEQHADPGTLIERFNALRARSSIMYDRALFDRKLLSAENAESTLNDYQRLLRNHVGKALYDQIQEASRKLRLLKAECVNLISRRGVQHTLELNEERYAEDLFPRVLRKLYFNCPLLKSLGALNVHTKTVEMNRILKQDWMYLLYEAKTLIDEVEHFRCMFKSEPVCSCFSYAQM
jgi:hypothetical protein